MIKVGKLKKAFHDAGLQLPTESVNILNDEMNRIVQTWIENTKRGDIKRLKPNLIWIALNRFDYY